jgi:hypothetical protein
MHRGNKVLHQPAAQVPRDYRGDSLGEDFGRGSALGRMNASTIKVISGRKLHLIHLRDAVRAI